MKVLVETQQARWAEQGREKTKWMTLERGKQVDVSGLHPKSEELDWDGKPYPPDTRWAIDFTPWTEWREMEVVQNPLDEPMSSLDLATHIIEELTWHGLPSSQEERFDEVLDRVEEFNRVVESGEKSPFKSFSELKKPDTLGE
jgi:hypothetical protein